MPTFQFVKRTGAPAGTINYNIAGQPFVIDDGANTVITTTDPVIAADLGRQVWLTPFGVPAAAPGPVVTESVVMVNGVLTRIDAATGQPVSIGSPGLELAYAENIGPTGIVIAAAPAQDIPNTNIAVPATSGPFYLHGRTLFQIGLGTGTVGADIQLTLYIADSAGNILGSGWWKSKLPASSSIQQHVDAFVRMAPISTPTTYKLQAVQFIAPAGAGVSIQLNDGKLTGRVPPTFLRAIGA